jgi:hypothetical protein
VAALADRNDFTSVMVTFGVRGGDNRRRASVAKYDKRGRRLTRLMATGSAITSAVAVPLHRVLVA